MVKSLLDILKDAGIFFVKSIDQGIYAHLQIDCEYIIKSSYYRLVEVFSEKTR
ncbi:MAG: hypothetical protein NUV46_04690 [Nanoarchaeota archaeon]|nr:hypothetical protein [Nanoarchaeota archaeon]